MKRLAIIVFSFLLLVTPAVALAEDTCDSGNILPPCTCSGDCQLTDFVQLFVNLYAFGVHLAAPLAVFFIIIGSVILVTASGYSNRIEMGKTIISQAVTGLIIVLISWVIVDTSIFLITGNGDRSVFGKPWFSGFTYVCDDDMLYQGCTGGNVSNLQRNLNVYGYNIVVDGSYGPQTAATVRQFQHDANSIFVTNALIACGGRAGGIDVWNSIFQKTCPAGECVVPQETAEAFRLPVNGAATTKTQETLENPNLNAVAPLFIEACKT